MTTTKKQKLTVPVTLAVGGILILGTILYLDNNKKTAAAEGQEAAVLSKEKEEKVVMEEKTAETTIVTTEGHIKGNTNADIMITGFSETECPYCGRFYDTMLQIMETYGKDGKVAWQYKNFPLDSIHPTARAEARAAECAASLGGNDIYWKYLDALEKKVENKDVFKVAEYVGLEANSFKTCVDNNTFENIVESDLQEGLALGVRGVPYSILKAKDGREIIISGAYPYEFLQIIIDMTLAGKSEEVINEFIGMVTKGSTTQEIEAFFTKNYPEGLKSIQTEESGN